MLRIGVLGVGHLGKIHVKCLKNTDFIISGIFDPNSEEANKVGQKFSLPIFTSEEELFANSDAVDIVSTTSSHFDLAKHAIESNKHIFIEKPVVSNLDEAIQLVNLAKHHDGIIQVGHVERFNPAFLSLKNHGLRPMFVEGHRLSGFTSRSTDVSVVLDLMIHDIDILLHCVQSTVKSIHANGVAVLSRTPDICNARIEFENGCVANLTASRMSLKKMRKLRLFQKDAYISIDFLEKETQIIRLKESGQDTGMTINTPEGKKSLLIESPKIDETNAIQMELESFYNAINNREQPAVSLIDGVKALELAIQIDRIIMENFESQKSKLSE